MNSAPAEQVDALRQALLAAVSEDASPEEAEAQVDALMKGDAPLLRAAANTERACGAAQGPFVRAYAAAAATGFRLSYLATFHGTATDTEGEDQELPLDSQTLESLEPFAENTSTFITEGFARLYEEIAKADSADEVRSVAEEIIEQASARSLFLGEVLGDASRRGVPAPLVAHAGPLLVSLSEAASRLGLLATFCFHAIAQSSALTADDWLEEEREYTKLEFSSGAPTGSAVQIGDLGDLEEGTLVEVQGRVEKLSLEHDPFPPKFSSFVVLRAFDTGLSVRLRAHMFSLAKNGLTEGACCKIRGFVRRKESWLLSEETGLDIDRVSLTKLRKSSWQDDVTYRMRPYYLLYKDEMNLFNTPGGV